MHPLIDIERKLRVYGVPDWQWSSGYWISNAFALYTEGWDERPLWEPIVWSPDGRVK
jgi:hypothetical protein